jgi:hypothetical protein
MATQSPKKAPKVKQIKNGVRKVSGIKPTSNSGLGKIAPKNM